MNKVEEQFKSHSKFQTDTHRKLDNSFSFETVQCAVHYASVVRYNGDGFMSENQDSMFNDQNQIILCQNSIVD